MDLISGIVSLFVFIICAFVWLLPIIFIGLSERTDGKEKIAWILAVIFITWFAWIFYLLLAPLRQRRAY